MSAGGATAAVWHQRFPATRARGVGTNDLLRSAPEPVAGRSHSGKLVCAFTIFLALALASSAASAFDRASYKSRLEATLAEFNAKDLKDSKVTLARLDQMIAIGIAGMKEYAAKQPKYAKLMEAAIADVEAMKGMTDVENEEKWGENGTGGDAVGVPLKSLPEFGETRAYVELVVGPARQYIFVKKWESTKKARSRWLEQARDEAVELLKHLESIK
jgi:hypothetical protein